jgi:hypothetical protein
MIKNPRTYVSLVVCLFSVLVFVKSDVHAASALLTYRVVDLGALEPVERGGAEHYVCERHAANRSDSCR